MYICHILYHEELECNYISMLYITNGIWYFHRTRILVVFILSEEDGSITVYVFLRSNEKGDETIDDIVYIVPFK